MSTLAGKRILITGAAQGIGLATARVAIERGARVALLDRDELALKLAVEELGADVIVFVADVTDAEQLTGAVDAAAAQLGGLDVVIANAGVAPKVATIAGTSLAELDRVMSVNVRGAWSTAQAGLPHLLASGGRLVLVASVYSFLNGAFGGPYAMSKAAVEAMGRALRVELASEGVGVTVGYFGFVDTALVRDSFDGDPLADRLEAIFPKPVTKRLAPEAVGSILLTAVERGDSRVIAPAAWRLVDWTRGVGGPLGDALLSRLGRIQDLLRDVRARETETPPVPAPIRAKLRKTR